MFKKILIANRGEIALRIQRACREMGIQSVMVYSQADRDAKYIKLADEAVCIGPAQSAQSYLNMPAIIATAEVTDAEAIHPGYGFLSENADFAERVERSGFVFIGPTPEAIRMMGDKVTAKQTMIKAGVPCVPGSEGALPDDPKEVIRIARTIGYPVIIKASGGGGGRGMRVVHTEAALPGAVNLTRGEAQAAFGNATVYLEKFLENPRHIEIQVLADVHGNAVHLGERECSLQRRHQKIIEEAPSPLLDEATRSRMGEAAVNAARSVGYTGAGTVEFIVSADRPDEFFFMEMNTRLQVEHPVTELVTGIDLVEQQILVASGEPLGFSSVTLNGHAVEARVYAEDPAHGFLPTGGTVLALREPSDVRVDSALVVGGVVGSDYDPMLAKVIAWAPSRALALRKLSGALARTAVLGLGTNVPFLRALLADDDVVAGTLDTQLVERKLDSLVAQSVPDEVFIAAALDQLLALQPSGAVVDPWDVPDNWRLGGRGGTSFRLSCADREVTVRITGGAEQASVVVDDGSEVDASASWAGDDLVLRVGARVHRYLRHLDGDVLWLAADGAVWPVAERSILESEAAAGVAGGPLVSPMPGTVLLVKAQQGEQVTAGQPLLVIEAMKMEHTIAAPVDGVLTELKVKAGQQVALNQPVALVTPSEEQS
jgi:acetyl-CoA/propionyl-CoA carboxylase biotin carboxyl carrier protein